MSAMRAANTRICSRFAKPLVVPAPSARPKLLKPLAPRVGVLESLSIDEDGEITWDVVLPNTEDTDRISWPSESVLDGYQLRPGQVPAAAPTSTLPTRPDSLKRSNKPVVLVRDTNAWCPFCERVWLALEEKAVPYDCVLIELYNKPEWYKELVPTSLVPAVSFSEDGAVVWESKDILLALEERFPHANPLLPTDEEEKQKALEFLVELEACGIDKTGYAFMTGGRMIGRSAGSAFDQPPPDMAELEAAFVKSLEWFEGSALSRHEGPYLLGAEFSMLDIMMISSLERIGAGLPKFRNFNIRSNPAYPNTAAWFAALAERPAYQKVSSDDQTLQLLFQRMMGLTPGAAAAATRTSAAAAAAAAAAAFAKTQAEVAAAAASEKELQAAKNEAYDALQASAGDVVRDILAKSGVTRYQASPYGATTLSVNGHKPRVALPVREAVEKQVVRVMKALLLGSAGPKPDTSIAAAFGSVAAAFLRNRHQDCGQLGELSPAAAEQLCVACTQALTQSYADGVEALVFTPPEQGSAAAAASAEAAAKIKANKEAIVDDILQKSGIARRGRRSGSTYVSINGNKSQVSPAVRNAVTFHLDRLTTLLLTGSAGPRVTEPEAAAVGAAALAFFRNRASAPRDMSAAATVQFRAACDAVLADIY
uniref:GST N-terminal domain-containing protein n=1 Tax=Tetradesmus obliquus TaxID=3088 RepID=A0A383VDH2_TETOB|eukprot:jgi/Sobl393_1/17150/SZX62990.1